jgi:putative PEP-CTERM system histidine kinase
MKNAAMLAFVAAFFGGLVALLMAFRETRTIPKWSFVSGMFLLSLESVFAGLAARSDLSAESIQYWLNRKLFVMALLPGPWLLFCLTYARGNGGEFLRRWRFVLVIAFVFPAAVACFFFQDLLRVSFLTFVSGARLLHFTTAGLVLCASFLVAAVLVLMNLERTFRASIGTLRWRIKFMILGLGALLAVRVYTCSQALLWYSGGVDELFLTLDSVALLLGSLLLLRSFFRAAVEVAVYPSFALLTNSLVVLAAGIYLLVIGIYAKILPWIGGGASFQEKAFLILVLLVGATLIGLSDRVRLRARQFFSRYFQRPLYDYRTVWRSFTEVITSRVQQEELCAAAVKEVADIFQALSVSIWLIDDKGENLLCAGSTSLSPQQGKDLAPSREESLAVIEALQNQPEPKDIEVSKEPWSATLRRCHPSQFRVGANRVAVAMNAGRQLMGVLLMGDRVGGIFFSLQDFELLKCITDQVAAGLLNAQLSQKLLQTKELEAFQTMSAFFVHDLKNTASTLNLMLQNLPVHFDNPAFREDALRGVAKTCQHINNLISRLSLLRHDLQIRPAERDLNDLVASVLANWNGAKGVSLARELRPCPKIMLDQDQMHKVVTNLVINASEAVGPDGKINVETSQRNGWAVVTVADNGCGMDPEFLRRALFRPFQTTKKNGFGIGMFQSKMIVEAHGGRIEVESELQKGTTFRVLLPIQKQLK